MESEYIEYLNQCIYDNIEFFKERYKHDRDAVRIKAVIYGSLQCRDKNHVKLASLLISSRKASLRAYKMSINYCHYRSIELSVERICRQISARYPSHVLSVIFSSFCPIDIS